jgi:hypothetical protein
MFDKGSKGIHCSALMALSLMFVILTTPRNLLSQLQNWLLVTVAFEGKIEVTYSLENK